MPVFGTYHFVLCYHFKSVLNIEGLLPKSAFVAKIADLGRGEEKSAGNADARRAIAEHFDEAADPKIRFAAEMGFGQQSLEL